MALVATLQSSSETVESRCAACDAILQLTKSDSACAVLCSVRRRHAHRPPCAMRARALARSPSHRSLAALAPSPALHARAPPILGTHHS